MKQSYVILTIFTLIIAASNTLSIDVSPKNELEYSPVYFSVSSDCLEISTSNTLFKEINISDLSGFFLKS